MTIRASIVDGKIIAKPLVLVDVDSIVSQAADRLPATFKGDKGDVGRDATDIGTIANLLASTIPANVKQVRTTGFLADGDGGDATYQRTTANLAAGGQGIWWFVAGDGSKWQIAPAAEHMAAQFGALGGNRIVS